MGWGGGGGGGGIYIRENLKVLRCVAVKPSPMTSRTRTKINIKLVVA